MGLPLAPLLDRMGKEDIYIKGVNAIDPEGKVGVLYAGLGAGTIGRVVAASRRKGFKILLPSAHSPPAGREIWEVGSSPIK